MAGSGWFPFFATAPKGLEALLADELRDLGAKAVKPSLAGVAFEADWKTTYRILLWTRLAGRVLMPVATFPVRSTDELYRQCLALDWSRYLDDGGTFAIDTSLVRARLTHSQFATQRMKDAIADHFRQKAGVRPSVDRREPDVRFNLYVRGEEATISLDLGGESLHRRGYRLAGGRAPLKEHLAAAMLIRARWPKLYEQGAAFVDPMCGSGTLVIEAALMAFDIAPGLLRPRDAVLGWKGADAALWRRMVEEAEGRREAGLANRRVKLWGYDMDPRVLERARANAERAGLADRVVFERRALGDWKKIKRVPTAPGLIVTNPPYGARLGELAELVPLYAQFGALLCQRFPDWQISMLTGNPDMGKHMGLRAIGKHKLYNGPIACELLHFHVRPDRFIRRDEADRMELSAGGSVVLEEGAAMFRNRLKKNIKQMGKWVRREGIEAYRIYDADMPEYNVAIDRYGDYALIQEYEAPATVSQDKAAHRLQQILLVAPEVLGIPREHVVLKTRRRQRGREQYEKLDKKGDLVQVSEHGSRFLVNLTDYLDTGLFLDHRPVRNMIRELADGRHFLNLFAYTGSASVHAAAGGAKSTLTLDLSPTYLEWARKNMALNGFTNSDHRYEREDARRWLERTKRTFGLIFVDAPSFSNSKKIIEDFDVQRHHTGLLRRVKRVLHPEGVVFFSNNLRGFKMDVAALEAEGFKVEDITKSSIPVDFARNSKIHQCWRLTHASVS